jgi:hypothetical protein
MVLLSLAGAVVVLRPSILIGLRQDCQVVSTAKSIMFLSDSRPQFDTSGAPQNRFARLDLSLQHVISPNRVLAKYGVGTSPIACFVMAF